MFGKPFLGYGFYVTLSKPLPLPSKWVLPCTSCKGTLVLKKGNITP